MNHRRRIATLVASGLLLLLPGVVLAHPLGNFTINHYAGIRVEVDRVLLDIVIDEAEIPAFQERQAFDLDADGSVSDEEIDAGRVTWCETLASSLELTIDGTPASMTTIEAGLTFPPGVGGLSTMRSVCGFEARLGAPISAQPVRISFVDASFGARLGWREITAQGSGVGLVAIEGELRDSSVSERLTSYPADRVASPLVDARLVVDAVAGGELLAPFDPPDAEPLPGAAPSPGPSASTAPSAAASAAPSATPAIGAVPGGVGGGELPGIFREANLTPVVLLLSLLTAAALGAGHALTPGHGKTLMAAYLVGTRGTALHALGLGLSVSLSHTVGILALAALVVGASDVLAPDLVVRWAPVVAAISIAAIGGWMLASELRRRRAVGRAGNDDHGHDHGHDHQHDHGHDHGPSTTGEHSHGGVSHSHVPLPGATITWRSLFLLGLAGGLIPSTSALLILLGSIAAGRPAFGFLLVVAFGIGMAAVMGGIGLILVLARGRLDRLPSGRGFGRVRDAVPLVAAVVVLGFGIYLTAQAIAGAPSL